MEYKLITKGAPSKSGRLENHRCPACGKILSDQGWSEGGRWIEGKACHPCKIVIKTSECGRPWPATWESIVVREE